MILHKNPKRTCSRILDEDKNFTLIKLFFFACFCHELLFLQIYIIFIYICALHLYMCGKCWAAIGWTVDRHGTIERWVTSQICCLLFLLWHFWKSHKRSNKRDSPHKTHFILTLYRHCRIFRSHLLLVHSIAASLLRRLCSSPEQIASMLLEPMETQEKHWNKKSRLCFAWKVFQLVSLTLSISCKRTRISSSS